MIAVIFELLPSREDRCRDLTAMLKAKLSEFGNKLKGIRSPRYF